MCLSCSQDSRRHDAPERLAVQTPPVSGDALKISVLSISKTETDPTSSAQEAAGECETWNLTDRQAADFFRIARQVDAQTYYHDYDTAPCMVRGSLRSGGKEWAFEVNGARKGYLLSGSERRLYGCEVAECESLGMW